MANDFIGKVAAAALADFDGAMAFLGLSGGKNQAREYLPINPTRNDHKPGSLSINRDSGAWSEFATDDRGGDLVALTAYVLGCRQIEAAERLADHFGIVKPDRQNQRQPNERDTGGGRVSTPEKKQPATMPADGAVCVMPIPDDAPAPPVAHSRHGRPAGRWPYTDAAGAVCFYHDRYEPKGERKQFSPLTLWRFPDGRMQWQFKAPPAPRPLLGLPDLEAKAGPVLIVEGEKARDAAVSLFPENPVITWQGGAQAVAKADWSPLAGRECWLWPDNDPAGTKAAGDVAAALAAVNAGNVFVFNLASFARRPIEAEGVAALADGDPLADGDDAADLVARGWTAAHAALLMQDPDTLRPVQPAAGKAAAAASEAPKSGRFQLDAKGVWLIETDRAPRWVCAPVEPVAMVRDPRNFAWGLLVEFFDPDRALHRVIVPMALFRGDGAEVAGLLLDQGLRIAPRGRPALIEYLQTASPKARARVTQRTGWHDAGPDGAAFVLPGDAIGPNAGAWIYESEGGPVHTFAMRGNLNEWQRELARLCGGNSRLLFAVSVCFASPLLFLIGAESGGFHFRSNSSDGKTTALRVAASVCGGADFMQRWRATSNGLEALASAHCDAPLLLDELAQMDPREAGETCYMLANGSGKSRAGRTGGARDRASWRLLFLSCGEIGLSEHLGEIGKTPRAGQELRLAEIPADAGAGLGVFENLHDYATGSEFAKALDRAARRHYGTAFHAFVSKLASNQEAVPDLVREAQRKFEAHCLNDAAHGQARRVAGRFALVGAAGELATKWGITGWQPGEALQAARTCFDAWLSRRGGQGNQEEKAMLRQVREFIRRKGESAFTDWDRPANDTDKHAPGKPDRAGYRRGCQDAEGNESQEYFLFNEAWRGVVCKGYDAAAVGRLLVAKGYCRKGSETDRPWLVRESLPTEGRARVVHILPALFESDDD
jgi:putative DNA primase/helicase